MMTASQIKKRLENFIVGKDIFYFEDVMKEFSFLNVSPEDVQIHILYFVSTGTLKKTNGGGYAVIESVTVNQKLDSLFFMVNEFYSSWDDGEKTTDDTKLFLNEVIKTIKGEK